MCPCGAGNKLQRGLLCVEIIKGMFIVSSLSNGHKTRAVFGICHVLVKILVQRYCKLFGCDVKGHIGTGTKSCLYYDNCDSIACE